MPDDYQHAIPLNLEGTGILCSLCKIRGAYAAVALPDGGITREGCQVWTFIPLCATCIDTAETQQQGHLHA